MQMKNFMMRAMMGVATFAMLPFVAHADQVLQPTKIPGADALGAAFLRPEAVKYPGRNGDSGSINVAMLKSKDGHMISGLYQSAASKVTIQSYKVDEFMYFLEGGVTLTSADGKVTKIVAGDAVTIPAGWAGTWDSTAYKKYYVIYDTEKK
jgi:uncharacterized cupin superfamily protein